MAANKKEEGTMSFSVFYAFFLYFSLYHFLFVMVTSFKIVPLIYLLTGVFLLGLIPLLIKPMIYKIISTLYLIIFLALFTIFLLPYSGLKFVTRNLIGMHIFILFISASIVIAIHRYRYLMQKSEIESQEEANDPGPTTFRLILENRKKNKINLENGQQNMLQNEKD